MLRGSIEASFCLSWSRLCVGSSLPRSYPRLEPSASASASASLILAWPRLDLEVFASILLQAHKLGTSRVLLAHLVHLANEFPVLIVVTPLVHFLILVFLFYRPQSVSICFASVSGWLPLPRFRIDLGSSASDPAFASKNALTTSLLNPHDHHIYFW